MNTPVRRVALAVMAMILLLMGNLTWVQVVQADDYRTDARNVRVLEAEYARQRGQISAGGQILASSVATDNQLRYRRTYADGPMYAPVTGYYSLTYGTSGLESAENDVLNGSADALAVRRFSDLLTGREPSGGNVVTTLDPAVQQAAYQEMTDAGYSGSVVALRPGTGEILGMVSTPSYDPNPLASQSGEERRGAWEQLNDAQPAQLTNRAIAQRYPPGSTFKLVDTAAALASGRYTPDSQLTAATSITLQGTNTQLENFNGQACGAAATASLREALQRSCNTAFVQLVTELGEGALREQAAALGIDEEVPPIPMSVATSTLGEIPDTAALQQSSIGQRDVSLTPLQNAMIVAAIANDGVLMAPHLVRELQSPELQPIRTTEPDRIRSAMAPDVANTLTEMMVNAENSYSGVGKIAGVQIAAKTGTAQWGNQPRENPPHVWYVGFAPAQDPQVAVAVLVEAGGDRNNLAATGGTVAAPVGRAVIRAALGGAG